MELKWSYQGSETLVELAMVLNSAEDYGHPKYRLRTGRSKSLGQAI